MSELFCGADNCAWLTAKVPRPWRRLTRPSDSSMSSERRMVSRDTPYSAARAFSPGMAVSTAKPPACSRCFSSRYTL
ncbi:hypothetical protein D3C71_1924540 [compost metagenome]